ncbi:hypothetical protein CDAR_294691 [Caerostris darwini]|uniref:Uncharacterized protein n=1 Tax=Caerostris darwini TaxID=1538125 RepID=A0AAV4UKK2_9ARAC|nr:hypothetical protein CDAR_294691 [Caerostris darwini]
MNGIELTTFSPGDLGGQDSQVELFSPRGTSDLLSRLSMILAFTGSVTGTDNETLLVHLYCKQFVPVPEQSRLESTAACGWVLFPITRESVDF